MQIKLKLKQIKLKNNFYNIFLSPMGYIKWNKTQWKKKKLRNKIGQQQQKYSKVNLIKKYVLYGSSTGEMKWNKKNKNIGISEWEHSVCLSLFNNAESRNILAKMAKQTLHIRTAYPFECLINKIHLPKYRKKNK